MSTDLLYLIALTEIPGIGNITAKKLIAYCGSAEQVYAEKKNSLEKIPGIGVVNAQNIINHRAESLEIAKEEIEFIKKNNITAFSFYDEKYPKRLTHCEDGPLVLYSKGNFDYNTSKIISIVGTRNATEYGKAFCDKLIEELKPHQPLIVSGLAFGIDICAHKSAIKHSLPTVAVLAHGLDSIYPSVHTSITKQMLENGGIISEFRSKTNPDKENFPKRNRIVAGMTDATIVIESSNKGGSLITAELANGYNRDVFALPGRVSDTQSEGCNTLIKSNRAHLIQSVKDIEYIMGWKVNEVIKNTQSQLFIELNNDEQILLNIISKQDKVGIDDLALTSKMPMSKTAAILLEMEFKNVVKSLPGKMYKIV